MSSTLALGEKLLALLDESARTSTYKPALLLALIDRAQDHPDAAAIPVRALAERVVELYWPQTLVYPETGNVLRQNQGGQAAIVHAIVEFRERHGARSRALPEAVRRDPTWPALLDRVDEVLAEWPIPRLQRPYEPFLYSFDWPWAEEGGWSVRRYRQGERAIHLFPETGRLLTALGPMLRPFITRWWTDKAAQLNKDVLAAQSVLDFEDFLFGSDRVALGRIAEGLLDLQGGRCFYCNRPVAGQREIDHFVPWSYSGDDGLDNLVAACRACNNSKRATLPGPHHLGDVIQRNEKWAADLSALADERLWPRDPERSGRIVRAAYLRSPDERMLWIRGAAGTHFETLGGRRNELAQILA